MKALREFAEVSPVKPENGDQLKLYKLVLMGCARDEAKASFLISDNHFNVLCKQLKEFLSDGVLSHPLKQLAPYLRAKCRTRRQYETAMMMISLDKKEAGIPLARATMRKAEKIGLYQVALDLSRKIRSNYSILDANTKYYRHYTNKQSLYKKELDWELQAEDLFYEFSFLHNKGLPTKDVEASMSDLEGIPSRSPRFHYVRYVLKAMVEQVNREEDAMLATCREALEYFEGEKNLPYVVRYSFYYRAIAVHISKGEYGQADLLLGRSLVGTARGKRNWQIIMIHRAILGFHSNKIAITFDAYLKARRVPKKHRTEQVDERWLIIRAYLQLYDVDLPGTWRLSRFLNSLPYSNKDKSGPILSVMIVELLHLLKARNYETYRIRCERLDDYIRAHLNDKKMERIIAFLRMLQCVVRGGFQRSEVQRKARSYLPVLSDTHPSIGADVREIEVVPFERLWGLVLDFLK